MAGNRLTKGLARLGALVVGDGSTLLKIKTGTFAVDPPNILANTTADVSVTLTGVAAGDRVLVSPPAALESGLTFGGSRATAADTLTIRIGNVTVAAIDGISRNWEYIWIDLTA